MSRSARRWVTQFWDQHVAAWLDGADPLGGDMADWFDSYAGQGRGQVTREGFVEPYQGDLAGLDTEPKVVILGLNPGAYFPELQARAGAFAEEIRACGSYSRWVVTHPYDREPWLSEHGPNRYYRARLSFTRRWLQSQTASYNDMLIFEMYPWHSATVTAPMSIPAAVVDRFVWQPLAELDTRHVFAFGAPWTRLAHGPLALPVVARFGRGGDNYCSTVPSRAVTVFRLPSRQLLVTESHAGAAGPPNAAEVEVLRRALDTLPDRVTPT